MKAMACVLSILLCIGAMSPALVLAEPVTQEFGFGGPMAIAYFPDMSGVNRFMSENGMPPMGDFLIGAGGSGRGGVIGNLAYGGMGWGVLTTSQSDDAHAELVFGGGGFDIGAAIAGDDSSLLTIGAVLGGGANVLSINGSLVQTIEPEGLVPEPMTREIGLAIGFVQPYLSMSAQLLPWMGFEFRVGYILPVFGVAFGDLLGIPAPSLSLSGPTISFGVVFGGIESSADTDGGDETANWQPLAVESDGSFVVSAGDEIVLENGAGTIQVSGYVVDTTQTASELIADWHAVITAPKKQVDEPEILSEGSETGFILRTNGGGRVSYEVRVPVGINLKVRNGAGDITVVDHQAQTIIVESGVGDVSLQGIRAAALIVASGIGEISLLDVDAQTLIANSGIGEIQLELPMDTSARLIARAGIGKVSIDHFPSMTGGVRGFIGESANVTLGHGANMIELNVGLGRIAIEMQTP